MPSLDGAAGWLNSGPPGPAELRGHVVLVNFRTGSQMAGLGAEQVGTPGASTGSTCGRDVRPECRHQINPPRRNRPSRRPADARLDPRLRAHGEQPEQRHRGAAAHLFEVTETSRALGRNYIPGPHPRQHHAALAGKHRAPAARTYWEADEAPLPRPGIRSLRSRSGRLRGVPWRDLPGPAQLGRGAAGQPWGACSERGPGTRGWQTVERAASATPRGRDRSE
jgi:hypothetical protein